MQKFTGAVVPLEDEAQSAMQPFTGELAPMDESPAVSPFDITAGATPVEDVVAPAQPAKRGTLPPQEFPDQVSRAQDVGPGPTSLTDVARNTAAGILKIGGTALKGGVDVANMLTGDAVDLGVSKSLDERMKTITQMVGTEQLNDQNRRFARLLADDSKSFGDMVTFLLDNPAVLADQGITTIGSMLLPAGAAGAAGKAAKALEWGAAATQKAVGATAIASSALQNAADTFGADVLEGMSKADRYKAAAVSGALSLVVGKLTGGGAEATIAKRLLGDLHAGKAGAVNAAENFLRQGVKEIGREAVQEAGEEVGNIAGELAGGAEAPSAAGVGKRVGLSATLGGILGGGAHVATAGPQFSQDLAQSRADTTAEAALEKARTLFDSGRNGQNNATGAPAPAPATTTPGAPTAPPTAPGIPPAEASEAAVQQPGYQPRADEPGIDPLTLQPIRPAQPHAGQIPLDPNDLSGSIAKMADAPLPAVDHVGALTVAAVDTIVGEQEQAQAAAEQATTAAETAATAAVEQERTRLKEASLEKVEPLEGAKAILRKNGYSEETIAQMQNLAIRQDATVFTKREQAAETNKGAKGAETVRSYAGQVRQGGKEGQPGVRQGAVKGGGDLQQPAPQGAGNGQARGNRKLGATEAVGGALKPRIKLKPVVVPVVSDADRAAQSAATSPSNATPEPTNAQAAAGNYKKGHVTLPAGGMNLSIENSAGSVRRDIHNEPPKWERVMQGYHYGYDKLTEGADADQVDIMLKAGTPADYDGDVFIIDAIDQNTGKFDEHKVIVGAKTAREAAAGYRLQYPKGWKVGKITATTMDGYRRWKSVPGNTKKPAAGVASAIVQTEAQAKKAITVYTEGESGKIVGRPLTLDAERNAPNRINGAAKRKIVKGSINDVREVAHLILGNPPSSILRAPGNGSARALTTKEHAYIAGMLSDAFDAGLDPASLKGLEAFHVYTPDDITEWARFQASGGGQDRSIGFTDHLMRAVLEGSKEHQSALLNLFLHEVGHELDTRKGGSILTTQSTAQASELEITIHDDTGARIATGAVIKEALFYNRTGKNAAIREFLDYPIAYWRTYTVGKLQEELFAQLHALWYTQRALLKSELPAAYAMMERVHNEVREIDRTGSNSNQAANARTAVQRALRPHGPVSEQSAAARADRGGVRGGPSERKAEREVGQDRTGSIAERFGNRFDYAARLEGKAAKQVAPDLTHLSRAMRPDEVHKLVGARVAKTFLSHLSSLPSKEEMAAVAWAGKAKRGWYRDAGQAISAVFGVDAPRFTAMLAAMSPRTSVEMNLQAALQTWNLWVKAGRPTSHSAIVALLPEGIANTAVLIGTAQANIIRALTHADPVSVVMSGPKVQSFFKNLMGNVDEVTNDGWMAAWANFKATFLGGRAAGKDEVGNLGGKSPGYIAMTVRAREAAQLLTNLTGETWTPREVQETVWSWAKTLYEWAGVDKSALDIVRNKELTDELIASTPDFASLLQGGVYEQNLRAGGYGPALDQLTAARRERAAARAGTEGFAGKKAPFATRAQQKHEEASAARLDALRETRANEGVHGQPQVPGGAVMDDFREDPASAVQKPGWAMLSGSLSSKTSDENAIRNEELESWFEKNKVEYHKIVGRYGGVDENSYLIFAPAEKALTAAKKFKQESIATSEGLEYTNGEVDPWDFSKTITGSDAVMGDHTVLPDGTAIALQLADKLVTKKALSTRLRPLDNLPGSSPGPSATVHRAAVEYMAKAGLPYEAPTKYVKVNPEYSKRIADAYAAMPHAPDDPLVKAAYAALIDETRAQWDAMMATGLKVDFTGPGNPYLYASPMDVVRDIRDNNHLTVFSTDEGFGSDVTFDPAENPLLAATDVVVDGKTLLANDLFRAVHDFFGHAKDGVGFRADGEENAWRAHAAMFSNTARKAMTTETRGQNSWLNYGPHGEKNRTAKTEDTVFADQKTGLLPDEFTIDRYEERGRVDTPLAGNVFVESIRDGATVRVERPAKQAIDENAALKDKMDKVIGCLGK